ncbi:hypothetical protein VD0001_g6076 [Verticillium dahliae]|uniref:VTC domain-containing protein n=1 Tax=Verticillium dahliae TaxID=27337 RepID=A0A444S7U7_VERDA|nr:hypothetical protein VD0001_g6076 [Verticillium dahliae]RXG49471.1 hypothetical protein VDGE_06772 [Verticillium dahliae]
MTDHDTKETKGFWGALFRSKSLARRTAKTDPEPRRASEGEARPRRRRSSPPDRRRDSDRDSPPSSTSRNRPRRSGSGAKSRDRDAHRNDSLRQRPPLTSWPPSNLGSREELKLGHAMELISRGVPAHKGHKRPIPHASDHYYALYTTSAGNHGDETDTANPHDSMTQFMTLRIQGSGSGRSDPAAYPWDTLEQPSYAFYFGRLPGTITLNQWASSSSNLPPTIALRDSGIQPRNVDLPTIFARLKELESSRSIDDNEERMYRSLYRRFLRDPDRNTPNPHRTLDRQITDLIMVLSRPLHWTDFSDPRHQVAARFIFDTDPANADRYLRFCHQLLLALELEVRIQARSHGEWAKEKLLTQLPPKIRWDLALAKRWRENVRVESWGRNAADIRLRYKLRRRQMRMLKRFAQIMKWPNLAETMDHMRRRDADDTLDLISSDALAFFSGFILPGATFPFLIMNTLIDVDPDQTTDALALLTHLHPACGFQHRSSYTYWSASCIVGKVLAPTCHALAGWVGPARPSPDLARSQIARVRSRKPTKQRLAPEDMASMSERSDPLGPPAEVFPVSEYKLVSPSHQDKLPDHNCVRIEVLGFKPVAGARGAVADDGPAWHDATVQFAIDGISWPLRLTFNVSFVSAWPCSAGPHPLFFDYVFETVRVDRIVEVRDWGGLYYGGRVGSSAQGPGSGSSAQGPGSGISESSAAAQQSEEGEKVLVVEAFGVPDNEVLARAWCSHWGLGAVVADVAKTCVGCAVREAYAATLTVVILVDGRLNEEEE